MIQEGMPNDTMIGIEADLDEALLFLLEEAGHSNERVLQHLRRSDTYIKFAYLKHILCERSAQPRLLENITTAVDRVLEYDNGRRPAYDVTKLEFAQIRPGNYGSSTSRPRISVWKGDIRDLAATTAIVNAANSQLLGCFKPEHACIDNAIHASAGPRLRQMCSLIMSNQDHLEPEGQVKITPGYNLRTRYVLHTVGPQMRRGAQPSAKHEDLLASCYTSCLAAMEDLPENEDGTKSIVFCGISTGLFGFPLECASEIAVASILRYFELTAKSSITHVIFDAFSDQDFFQYRKVLHRLNIGSELQFSNTGMLPTSSARTSMASTWFKEADLVIVSAGAGLSADAGLDYTSRAHFSRWLPGFTKYGFSRLYDVFGFDGWPNAQARWSYLINHLIMIRDYPRAQVYDDLQASLQDKFSDLHTQARLVEAKQFFIRTTNADGFFEKHGFSTSLISTPQGQYNYVQCMNKCRPDAVFSSKKFVDQAEQFLDSKSQHLPEDFQVPNCPHCGSDLVLCVRGGDYFNDVLFRPQEQKYKQLVENLIREENRKVVILELGVGMNTPSVLRWHDESVARRSNGNIKLIRFGLGPAGYAPLDLEETGLAVGLEGRVGDLLPLLKH